MRAAHRPVAIAPWWLLLWARCAYLVGAAGRSLQTAGQVAQQAEANQGNGKKVTSKKGAAKNAAKNSGNGTTAPLTEEGYAAVAAESDNEQMTAFIRRVLVSMNRKETSADSLAGFVPFYSGKVATQDLAHLKKELKTAAWVVMAAQGTHSKDVAATMAAPIATSTARTTVAPTRAFSLAATTAPSTMRTTLAPTRVFSLAAMTAPSTMTTTTTQFAASAAWSPPATTTAAPTTTSTTRASTIAPTTVSTTTSAAATTHTTTEVDLQVPKAVKIAARSLERSRSSTGTTVTASGSLGGAEAALLNTSMGDGELTLSDVDAVLGGSFSRLSDFTTQADNIHATMIKRQEAVKAQLTVQRETFALRLGEQQRENELVVNRSFAIRAQLQQRVNNVTNLQKRCKALYHGNVLVRNTVETMDEKIVAAVEYIENILNHSAENLEAGPLKVLATTTPKPTLDRLLDDHDLNRSLVMPPVRTLRGTSLLEAEPTHFAVQHLAKGIENYDAAAAEGGLKLKAYFLAAQEREQARHAILLEEQAELNKTEAKVMLTSERLTDASKHLLAAQELFRERLLGIQVFAKRASDHIEKVLQAVEVTPNSPAT